MLNNASKVPVSAMTGVKLLFIITGIALLIVIGASWLLFYQQRAGTSPLQPSPSANEPESWACTMEAKICSDGSAVGRSGPNCEFAACPDETGYTQPSGATQIEGGLSYRDPANRFKMQYPSTFTLDQQSPDIVRLYVHGPTQRGQTEIYDGALVVVEVLTYEANSFSDWVDTQLQSLTADGTTELIAPKTPLTINGQFAYTYTVRGLGSFPTYIIQQDPNSNQVARISTLIADPTNQGFQSQVDAIISTFEFASVF